MVVAAYGVYVWNDYRHPTGDLIVWGDAPCVGARVLVDGEPFDTLRLRPPGDEMPAEWRGNRVTAWLYRRGESSAGTYALGVPYGPHLVQVVFGVGDTLNVRAMFAEYNSVAVSRPRRQMWFESHGSGSGRE